MAIHDVKYLSWHPASKVLWVYVDGNKDDRAALMCSTEEQISSKIEEYVKILDERDNPLPGPRKYSKMKLYIKLVSDGLWESFKAFLENIILENGVNAYTAFEMAQELSDENQMFKDYLEAIKTTLGISDEKVQEILDASVLEG